MPLLQSSPAILASDLGLTSQAGGCRALGAPGPKTKFVYKSECFSAGYSAPRDDLKGRFNVLLETNALAM